jgi:hypothetical protein
MLVLVINSGSSSIKFRLVEVVEEPTGVLTTQPAMLQGAVKGIGGVANFEMTGRDAPPSTSGWRFETMGRRHVFCWKS